MKTSVTKFMMSFALMGCLIFGASDAMAQGRSRSQGGSTSSRSQSAAVSRSSNTSAPTMSRDHSSSRSSATPQVNRSSSTSTTRSSATPQVNRSSSTSTTRSSATPQVNRSSSTSTTRSSATPQVNRSSSTSTTRSSATPQVNRSSSTSTSSDRSSRQSTAVRTEKTTTHATSSSGSRTGHGAMTRGGDNSSITHSTNVAPRDNNERTMTKPEATTKRDNRSDGVKPGNGGKHDNGGKPGGGKPDNGGKPGNGGKPDNGGKPSGGKPDNGGKPGGGHHDGKHGGRGYGPDHRYDYNSHPHRDAFSWNYSHHSWSRPLPPPVRPYRPAPWVWYRPTIPVGWHPYSGAPVIDRILGLVFGSLYDASLDHLYYSGYYIDGYADGIIYLRDVPMLNLYWPDVMLNYDYNRLVNAQFVYHTRYYDTSRYDMVYNSLRRIYGSPVYRDGMVVSWYGGDSRGYVTLSMVDSPDGYYTTMSIGY